MDQPETGLRVVVGVDGSPEAQAALAWACRLASVSGGEVVVVHAIGLLEELHGELVIANRSREEIERVVDEEWCAAVAGAHGLARLRVADGHPVDLLPKIVEEEDADLLVVGTRGAGTAPARELGSTSLHLLRNGRCPMLVVPRPEVPRETAAEGRSQSSH